MTSGSESNSTSSSRCSPLNGTSMMRSVCNVAWVTSRSSHPRQARSERNGPHVPELENARKRRRHERTQGAHVGGVSRFRRIGSWLGSGGLLAAWSYRSAGNRLVGERDDAVL